MITQYKKYSMRVLEKPKQCGKVVYESSIHELPYPPMHLPKENLLLQKEFETKEKAVDYAKKCIDNVLL